MHPRKFCFFRWLLSEYFFVIYFFSDCVTLSLVPQFITGKERSYETSQTLCARSACRCSLACGYGFSHAGLGSGREVFDTDDYADDEEEEEGTLPEGWIEIGDHEYMNPSTGEWAKVHVTEEN